MTAEAPAPLKAAVATILRCPVCAGGLEIQGRVVACHEGHRFDLARQGYVTLRGSAPSAATADTPGMVAARERFLGSGAYAPIAAGLAEQARIRAGSGPSPVVLDLAGGTGYYLGRVLDAIPGALGVCLDLSAPALRRAARSHPRTAAVGSDVWQRLPAADSSVSEVTSVFGPRNASEIARVLVPGGSLITVTPTARHLAEVIGPLGMLRIGEDKQERLAATLDRFAPAGTHEVEYLLRLDRMSVADLAGMGPSAHHLSPERIQERVAALPDAIDVTVSVSIGVHRLRPESSRSSG